MNRYLITAAVLVLATMLVSCKREQEQTVLPSFAGKVVDVTPNSVSVVLTFNTLDEDELPGVFIGDSIRIGYERDGESLLGREISLLKADPAHLIDTWTEYADSAGNVRGFTLNDDGTAQSLNTDSCEFRRWKVDRDGNLVMTAVVRDESGRRRREIVYRIVELNSDSLVLEGLEPGQSGWSMSNKLQTVVAE